MRLHFAKHIGNWWFPRKSKNRSSLNAKILSKCTDWLNITNWHVLLPAICLGPLFKAHIIHHLKGKCACGCTPVPIQYFKKIPALYRHTHIHNWLAYRLESGMGLELHSKCRISFELSMKSSIILESSGFSWSQGLTLPNQEHGTQFKRLFTSTAQAAAQHQKAHGWCQWTDPVLVTVLLFWGNPFAMSPLDSCQCVEWFVFF